MDSRFHMRNREFLPSTSSIEQHDLANYYTLAWLVMWGVHARGNGAMPQYRARVIP